MACFWFISLLTDTRNHTTWSRFKKRGAVKEEWDENRGGKEVSAYLDTALSQ